MYKLIQLFSNKIDSNRVTPRSNESNDQRHSHLTVDIYNCVHRPHSPSVQSAPMSFPSKNVTIHRDSVVCALEIHLSLTMSHSCHIPRMEKTVEDYKLQHGRHG